MKNTLFICLFALCAFSGCVDDEEDFLAGGNTNPELTPENKEDAVLNAAVFDQLNLDYPGLEKVKQYYEAGETIEVVISRANSGEYKEQTVEVTLGSKPSSDK